ncbi:MAG: glycosyltransferase family 4 protein [Pirellulales bacterium]
MGDPWDVFAPGAVRHPLRPFLRWRLSRELQTQCEDACAAAYVTAKALQRRYPASPNALSTDFSDVELHSEHFLSHPRSFPSNGHRLRLVTVGTLEQLYKAPDILIEATAHCVARGLDIEVVFVGDGQYRNQLEEGVRCRGMADRVRFVGQLSAGELVRRELDGADLFVLPSRTEGLPRAMIEAMARGLPCIGSTVGGIPELLPAEDLVPPGDAAALAAKLRAVLADLVRMTRMSARNLAKAREYREEVLRARRVAFYGYVRERTEKWLRNKAA